MMPRGHACQGGMLDGWLDGCLLGWPEGCELGVEDGMLVERKKAVSLVDLKGLHLAG